MDRLKLWRDLAQGETVDPSEYYFRVAPVFETGVERDAWLNKILAVGVGERLPPNVVRYSIFECASASKRDPAPSVIKALLPLCEFRFRRVPDRCRWGPNHDV